MGRVEEEQPVSSVVTPDPFLFQLLERIRKVNFHLHKDTVTFNDSVDPLSSYNIIAWDWTFRVIGSSTWSPVQPDINKTKIQWHDKDNQVIGMWSLIPRPRFQGQPGVWGRY